jgi:GTP diphosphokinase / guanosine-3',5'-bis(diphosphate) 3'-diphosphatase
VEELIPPEELEKYDKDKQVLSLQKLVKQVSKRTAEDGVKVSGMDNIFVRFAKCCSPVPGDFIVGYITRGRGISIHTRDCPSMAGLEDDAERKIEVEWEKKSQNAYPVRITIETEDKPGLLGKISSAIASWNVNISWANVETFKDKTAILDFDIAIAHLDHLNKVINTIKDIKGVTKAERIKNPYKYKAKIKEKKF